MTQIVSFVSYTPPQRFDSLPWTHVQIEEAPTSTGSWTIIDTLALSPLDVDPTTPQARSFTTANGTAADQWYRISFVDAGAHLSEPTPPVQNTAGQAPPVIAYIDTDELFRILKVRSPSADQITAAERVIMTASGEIDAEISRNTTTALETWQLQLAESVCLDRAADLWRHSESAPGILGVVDEAVPSTFGRYSWERYAQRLSPIKEQWGIA
jgi:hypothetical protein